MRLNYGIQIFTSLSRFAIRHEPNLHQPYIYLAMVQLNFEFISWTWDNVINITWESPTLLWTFKLMMRAGETRNSLNACFIILSILAHGSVRRCVHSICTIRNMHTWPTIPRFYSRWIDNSPVGRLSFFKFDQIFDQLITAVSIQLFLKLWYFHFSFEYL